MKKNVLICLFFFLFVQANHAFSLTLSPDSASIDSTKKNRLLPGPVFNYSPETKFVFGLSALYTFYLSKDRITRPSVIFLTGIYTLREQLISDFYINSWSKQNRYHYIFDISYYKYNYYFYGIGNNTKLIDETLLNQRKPEVTASIERRMLPNYYMGLEFNYKKDQYPEEDAVNISNIAKALGIRGGTVARLGISASYDSRNNLYYATAGHFVKFTYSQALSMLSGEYVFDRYIFESRNFFTFDTKHTIGLNTNIESVQGNVPFFELRQLGSPYIMRGYYAGRFRDQNLAAAQVEYRWHFVKRFGFVTFAGTGCVFNNTSVAISDLKPNFGFGLRYFYDIPSGINIRVDYGWGEKIPGEGRIGNFYIYVAESF